MPKVSINILTKNRAELLKKALESVAGQSLQDFEVVVVNDGSTDNTIIELENIKSKFSNLKIINHSESLGITLSRQEALEKTAGEYVAILDDDDEWVDVDKLKKQVEYLDTHPDVALVGGGIVLVTSDPSTTANKSADYGAGKLQVTSYRPETDFQIRKSVLLRNNFFTSTVMFRREVAIKAGGFIKDDIDLAEDYDLWLRMGKLGKMYNFQVPFVKYRMPSYNKEKFNLFLQKQLKLVNKYRNEYSFFRVSWLILKLRLLF